MEHASFGAYDGDTPVLWDAAEYEQQNPLLTGADGSYEWLTPVGDWLVTAEKAGYYMATSSNDPEAVDGWLPVPPPQMNVNIGMVSMDAPQVSEVRFSGAEVRVTFSQYMDSSMLEANPALVTVRKNGQSVPVEQCFIDLEVSPKNDTAFYGRTLYLTPAEGHDFDVGIAVRLLDTGGAPMAGKRVYASQSFDLYELPDYAVTDANGRAVFSAVTLRSGGDVLRFTCEDASAELNTYVNPLGTSKPTANLTDFAVVKSGTTLTLSCATEGATIRYTFDDTCPCEEAVLYYTGPITIAGDVFVRAAAWTEAGGYSERLNLHLTVGEPSGSNADLNADGVVDTGDVGILLLGVVLGETDSDLMFLKFAPERRLFWLTAGFVPVAPAA